MNKGFNLISISVVLLLSTVNAYAVIDSVEINPLIPTHLEAIDIITNATEVQNPVFVTNTLFNMNGNNLQLDIYLDIGPFLLITPWDYTHDIGTLPVGIYNLTVNVIDDHTLGTTGTYDTSFEVVPEPTVLLLLTTGAFFIRKRR